MILQLITTTHQGSSAKRAADSETFGQVFLTFVFVVLQKVRSNPDTSARLEAQDQWVKPKPPLRGRGSCWQLPFFPEYDFDPGIFR